MPGATPLITQPSNIPPDISKQVSPQTNVHALPGCTCQHLVTHQAINVLTICEMATADKIFTPRSLLPHAKPSHSPHFEHYASPMVHPVTGKTISSYKKLLNNPATAEVWQTAFSQDFGGMAQGCDKTSQKGTNTMFVMTHKEIAHALQNGTKFTYGYGARMGGSKSNAVNLILRLFLYHILHTMSL
jgi:hypothetical protein